MWSGLATVFPREGKCRKWKEIRRNEKKRNENNEQTVKRNEWREMKRHENKEQKVKRNESNKKIDTMHVWSFLFMFFVFYLSGFATVG